MNQIELIKVLMKNTHVNFLLGAGTSYNPIPGKIHYPLMKDLLEHIKSDTSVMDFYSTLETDRMIPNGMGNMIKVLYDSYLFAKDSNIENFCPYWTVLIYI